MIDSVTRASGTLEHQSLVTKRSFLERFVCEQYLVKFSKVWSVKCCHSVSMILVVSIDKMEMAESFTRFIVQGSSSRPNSLGEVHGTCKESSTI